MRLQLFSGIENTRRRMTGHAALANYIRVTIHPGTRFRVVVVQAERVSVWLLQEVDNLAVLMGPLGQPFLLGLPFKR